MSSVNSVNNGIKLSDFSNFFKQGVGEEGGDVSTIIEQRLNSLISIISGKQVSFAGSAKQTSSITPFSTPALEDPDAEESDEGGIDLEKVISLLQADTDEKVLDRLRSELKNKKSSLATNYKKTQDNIKKSVEAAQKAEKAEKKKKAWGIFGAILAVVAAVVVTVVTGGLAAGFAIAGAALAVASCVLDLTGASKKICKAMADSLQKKHPDWSKAECNAAAQGIYGGIFLALSLVCMVGGFLSAGSQANALKESVKAAVKMVKNFTTGGNALMFMGGTATNIEGIVVNKKAGDATARVTDDQAILLELQKKIEENNEDIEKMLQALQDAFTGMFNILEHKTDTENAMLAQTVQMA